ncbi:unnamed protein product [Rhizoctonia solani]|uniref:Uncharacterized protein n=1 Tax=Rhizoctonia solani TaxID=456999 RepID=A0A8H3DB95_9AGAM|nr:unnamed protein product [Rhizoctonia solani]
MGIGERLGTANEGLRPRPRRKPIQPRSAEGWLGSEPVLSQNIGPDSLKNNPGTIPMHDSSLHRRSLDTSGISILSAGILETIAHSYRRSEDISDTTGELEDFDKTWPQEQSQSLVRPRTFNAGTSYPCLIIQSNVPRAVNANAQMRMDYFTFILSEYEIHRLRKFFKPPPMPLSSGLTSRMKRSNTILGFMYLGAKVFEALNNGPKDTTWKCCKKWIANFDRQVTNHPAREPSVQESEDRLTGLLELAYLTFLVVDTVAGYALLKRARPLFLHLVSNYRDLCSERNGQLAVSLPRVLLTLRYEIKRFVFYDMMCALALGVMPVAEYDPGESPVVMYPPLPTEVFHGVPIEWILIIGHIHARTSNWRSLEAQILSWHPRVSDIWGEESVEARVCGVDSLDRRVQASVKQIVRLMEVVHDPPMDVHLSMPCIMAGIAARYETQRTLIYQKLLSFRNTHIWVLRGADFAPVLKHVWHGAGANEGAVTWGDYVNSRCALLPLP